MGIVVGFCGVVLGIWLRVLCGLVEMGRKKEKGVKREMSDVGERGFFLILERGF